MKKFTKRDYIIFGCCAVLVVYAIWYNQDIQAKNQIYFPRPLTDNDIKLYSNTDPKAIVIYPIFTQYAYQVGGFYDYWKRTCQTCNVISISPLEINASYTTGLNGFEFLTQLHYPFITDIMVDRHPEILNEFDKIILLHNEYMTKTEFEAIKNHKNVIYLYPNSMYVQIAVDYTRSKISLVRGHGYPDNSTANGFDYVTNSNHEYDLQCKNYKWEAMPNGIEPTCWPEFLIKSDRSVLGVIKDFPYKMPDVITPPAMKNINVSNMGYCDYYGICKPKP